TSATGLLVSPSTIVPERRAFVEDTGAVFGCLAIVIAEIANKAVSTAYNRLRRDCGNRELWVASGNMYERILPMFIPNPLEAVRSRILFQTWSNISFLHWRFDAQILQSRLPLKLEIDSFGDSAWISLTPFLLKNLRPPFVPSLPWLSRFPETNLRTYVHGPA